MQSIQGYAVQKKGNRLLANGNPLVQALVDAQEKTDGYVCAAVKAVLPEFTSGTRKETGISL